MPDYEALILARQEELDEHVEFDCRFCKFLDNCRKDDEQGLPHYCYLNEQE